MPKKGEIISECDGCVSLLHYEFGGEKHNRPRCSIGFRDGSKIKQPCADKMLSVKVLKNEKQK